MTLADVWVEMMGGSQEPRSSPGVTGPGVRPDTCPLLSWPPDIVSVQGFNYQIRSGVAHTLPASQTMICLKT